MAYIMSLCYMIERSKIRDLVQTILFPAETKFARASGHICQDLTAVTVGPSGLESTCSSMRPGSSHTDVDRHDRSVGLYLLSSFTVAGGVYLQALPRSSSR